MRAVIFIVAVAAAGCRPPPPPPAAGPPVAQDDQPPVIEQPPPAEVWHRAGKDAAFVGPVKVEITRVTLGPIGLLEPAFENTTESYLRVRLHLENTSADRKADYTSWGL